MTPDRIRIGLAAALLLATLSGVRAQSVVDGSGAAIGPESTGAVLALLGRQLRSGDAKVTGLRKGRAGAVCGSVEVRNRMGAYTGPRGFVADLADGFAGRLPEGPELRSPAGMADYRAMERARTLFGDNCTDG